MNRPAHTVPAGLTAAAFFMGSCALLPAGEVGPIAAYAPPAPVSDCDACNSPGWYAGAALLYLKSYDSDIANYDGDWDFGGRAAVGFERPDGLFFELSGFWFQGDFMHQEFFGPCINGELELWYVDALVGDNLHCGESCLDIAFGLRYVDTEQNLGRNVVTPQFASPPPADLPTDLVYSFEGIGPVIELSGTRAINEQFELYAELRQAILFGETDTSFGNSNDAITSISELAGGIQFNFNAGGIQDAWARLGIEGQYWKIDGSNVGLFGGTLGVGFNF